MLSYKETTHESTKFYFFIDCLQKPIDRRMVLDLFTPCQRPVLSDVPEQLRMKDFILVTGKNSEIAPLLPFYTVHVPQKDTDADFGSMSEPSKTYAVYGVVSLPEKADTLVLYRLQDDASYAPFSMQERFYMDSTMISNYKGDTVVTDVGKFFCNKLLLAEPFGDLIPYINEPFNIGKIDDMVANLLLAGKATREMYNTYMNNGFWFGTDGSIATACWSEKSLTTDPNLPKRRQELLEKYKNNLHDPTAALAIEKELIEMDKAYLKGDTSEPFYAVTAGKSYGEARKKMYGIFGLGVAFGQKKGVYDFTAHSLEDGWEPGDLAIVANDVRRGSYGRSMETAKGGEQTKLVLRMFQEVKMEEGDCGSTTGLLVTLTERNYKFYIGRYLVSGTMLTEENIKTYLGKEVEIRSPMFCKSKNYCSKCCGEFFRQLKTENIGMQSLAVCSTFVGIAMKTMHASSLKTVHLQDIDRFFKQPRQK